MNLNPDDNNDQCQHPDGCIKSFFTYCPHCHLYLCINHLNQHHDTMKIDIHRTIDEANNHRILLEQQINRIKQQQTSLNNIYERELKILNDKHEFLTHICENSYVLISEYEQYIKQFELIKQDQINNSFILEIDQILQQQQNSINKSKDEISTTTNILSILDNEITIDSNKQYGYSILFCFYLLAYSESCEKEVLLSDSTMDCHSIELSIDPQNDSDSDTFSRKSKSSIISVYSTCPLAYKNAFGFSSHHNIPHVPCNLVKDSDSLTYDRCYYHLISYHRLRPKVARIILNTLSSNENKILDLTKFNIFSQWTSNDILSQGTTLFIGKCPLTQEHIYGIKDQHNVSLCTPRSPVHLYQHLRSVHCLKSNYARRLINAMIKNIPLTEEIFKPNEQIINNSFRFGKS